MNFDKISYLTREFILSQVDEIDIFQKYIKEPIKINKIMKSPLREGDQIPSFNIFKNYNGELRYKDFGANLQGNCFQFVSDLYNCSHTDAIKLIGRDFKLNDISISISKKSVLNELEIAPFQKKIIPIKRNFKIIDYNYWNQFYIPLDYLIEDNCYACNYVYLKNRIDNIYLWGKHKDNDPIYCYEVGDKHKVYRPLTVDKTNKWLGTITSFDILGLEYIPKKGELLIITSSMKDRWVLKKLGYNSIAPPSESTIIPKTIMDFLWASFDNIVLFYDNDKPGKEYSNKMIENYPELSEVFIPNEYQEKDISDFIKVYGLEDTKQLIKKLL